MSDLTDRPYVVLDIQSVSRVHVLKPEQVVLKFPGNPQYTIDIGALCYLRRDFASKRKRTIKNPSRKVDLQSFDNFRALHFRNLIGIVAEDFEEKRLALRTIIERLIAFCQFFDWTDNNTYDQQVLAGETEAQKVFSAYVLHLRNNVTQGTINLKSACALQNAARTFLEALLNLEAGTLARGLNVLRRIGRMNVPTEPPDEKLAGRVLALCDALFNGICDFVLEQKSYPQGISMPSYLGFTADQMWVFPTRRWFLAPHAIKKRDQLGVAYWAYDYENGHLATMEEIAPIMGKARAKEGIKRAEQLIFSANADTRHPSRIRLAMVAHNAFVLLFLANKIANQAPSLNMDWDDDFDITQPQPHLRQIKFRAGGLVQHFEVQATFLPAFRRFVELRKFLLGDQQIPFFFVSIGSSGNGPVKPISSRGCLPELFTTLRNIDPSLDPILVRQWRKSGMDFLVNKFGVATAAVIGQNSENTVHQAYADGTHERHLLEMTAFFNAYPEAVRRRNGKNEVIVESPTGNCSQVGCPVPIDSHLPQPSCRGEGCLFCKQAVFHPDELGAKKLLSCRYVVQLAGQLAANEEHYKSVIGPIIGRIDFLLERIAEYAPDGAQMIERIRTQIDDEGQLTAFWQHHLDLCLELGVL